jgi:hypothetical protein
MPKVVGARYYSVIYSQGCASFLMRNCRSWKNRSEPNVESIKARIEFRPRNSALESDS